MPIQHEITALRAAEYNLELTLHAYSHLERSEGFHSDITNTFNATAVKDAMDTVDIAQMQLARAEAGGVDELLQKIAALIHEDDCDRFKLIRNEIAAHLKLAAPAPNDAAPEPA